MSGEQADRPEESSGFDRRQFLRRAAIGGTVAWATPMVTSIGISRASASPCVTPSAGSTGSTDVAAPSGLSDPSDLSAPAATSSHDKTHTPCYRACSEQRVTCEAQGADQLDACAQGAGADSNALYACADAFRTELFRCTSDWLLCTQAC